MITKADLIHGAYYRGTCRNAEEARWNADTQCFYYWRYKYGNTFVERINHPEDDAVYDVFVPSVRAIEPTRPIPFD